MKNVIIKELIKITLEVLNVPIKQTEMSVAYFDHCTTQSDFVYAGDQEFKGSTTAKYESIYSKPGNETCLQVDLERVIKLRDLLMSSISSAATYSGAGTLLT